MDDLRVVGHRGVRGINIENTKSALADAAKYGVDAIEFDVRLTQDQQLVLCHNRNLKKVYGVDRNVDDMSLANLQELSAANGETIPTLQDILNMDIKTPLLMDVKNQGSADLIYQTMQLPKNRHIKWAVTTFVRSEATRFKEVDPSIWVSLGTIWHPFETIKIARQIGANSMTINAALLNPVDYFKARRAGLAVMLYMNYLPFLLTTPWLVRFFRRLYPRIIICTDRPDKIVPAVKG